jgi:hypothetical protein
METVTLWYHYLAYFFGGTFLANAPPHVGNGISGRAFQSPLATPPGVGLSSSMFNVLWGFLNLAIAYLLVCRVGSFELRKTRHILVFGSGIPVMSLMPAHAFGRFYGRMTLPNISEVSEPFRISGSILLISFTNTPRVAPRVAFHK